MKRSLPCYLLSELKCIFFLICFLGASTDLFSQFTNEAFNLGIDHVYPAGGFGAGVSLVDINGDGLDDLTLATGEGVALEIYLQTQSGLELLVEPTLNSFTDPVRSINWIDYDNNGTKDLFVTLAPTASHPASVRLFEQTPQGTFINVTDSSLIGPIEVSSYGSSWADYDQDGFLDLYLNTYNTSANFMFHNLGDGTFEEVALDLGLQDEQGVSFTSVFFDADLDGVLDLFTANDRHVSENRFYKGNADGTFTDISVSSEMNANLHSMGVDVGDYDNDGDLDIYVTNSDVIGGDSLRGNVMFMNEGDLHFRTFDNFPFDVFYGFFWGCNFVDYDFDRDLDLFAVCGARDFADPGRVLFDNDGSGTFSAYTGIEFMPDQGLHYGSAIGDINADGWTDLIVLDNIIFRSQIWKNPGGTNNWIKLHLEGTVSSKDAIGSLIEVWVDGKRRIDQTSCGNSYASQDSDNYPFGLGTANMADSVIIRWPNGHTNIIYNLAGGMRHVLVEDTSTYELNTGLDCSLYDQAPVDLTKSFDPVNGVQDRVQVKWYKESPQVKYGDEDAAACDIRFWAKRNLDPLTGNPIGPAIQDPDTIDIIDAKKSYGDGSPRSIFKWPIKFRADGANNTKRAEPNIRYEWQVRCACDHGAAQESPWSEVKIFNTPDFDPITGIYSPPPGIGENLESKGMAVEPATEMGFTIYPNPNDGRMISIDFEELYEESVQIQIFDITGRLHFSESSVNSKKGLMRIELESTLDSGAYFLEVSLEYRRGVERFVVN